MDFFSSSRSDDLSELEDFLWEIFSTSWFFEPL